jgi:cytochrome oxidase Cu insertion factor (SCO1/SenC/PrrC family)
MRSRLLIGALVSLAAVSAALATVIVHRVDNQAPQRSSGEALVGGPFALTDHHGRQVSDADFRGRWMVVQFGYTYCPDVCPLGLQTIAEVLDGLPESVADEVAPIFVTIDPERDTTAVLADYVELFHPRILGLTGTPEEVDAAAKAYRVYARKVEDKDGGAYLMDHSAFTYLMGPDGRYVTHFSHTATPDEIAATLLERIQATS